ncbi:uncharacterized protein RSE6_03787 [Rhynchosporium secalis]|uniref:Uncharacterized protein n=1 Tax=Rhynchosporium secalis TaxID=38038 RepID=A0A1E1M3M6_RHYSE|nr:uncharacterized protein RSE6_03787 [Rhynchosporium secalis]
MGKYPYFLIPLAVSDPYFDSGTDNSTEKIASLDPDSISECEGTSSGDKPGIDKFSTATASENFLEISGIKNVMLNGCDCHYRISG